MRLIFGRAVIENFGAILKQQNINLRRPGLNFVHGENLDEPDLGANGAGKSTIWNAITWCLFARTLDGLRNPDIAPWYGKGSTYVRLRLTVDENLHWIERSTNPNRLTVCTTHTSGLTIDKPASQEQVERLIGMGFETFRNTIILGQGRELFLDLEPSRKMTLFSDVLNLNKWEDWSGKALLAARVIEAKLSDARAHAEANQAASNEVAAQVKVASHEHNLWEVGRVKIMVAAKGDLAKMEKEHEAQTRQQIKYNLNYDGAMTELKACEREITELEELRDHAKSDYDKHELDMRTATAEAVRLAAEFATLSRPKAVCPTCGQSITAKDVHKHKAEIEERLAAYRKTVSAAGDTAAKSALSDLEKQIAVARTSAEVFVAKADKARDAMDTINKPLAELSARIEQIHKARKSKEDEVNPYTRQLSELRKRTRTLREELSDIKAEITKHEQLLECTSFWVKGFKDVRLQIIEEVLQELEMCTDAMVGEVGLNDWKLLFDVERETASGGTQRVLHVSVKSKRMPKAVKFNCFSGGEKQRLRLVGSLALADVLLNRAGVVSEFEALDEPSRGLSVEGLYDLIDFLADRARDHGKAIFLTDHRVAESNRFASTLLVKKTASGTTISG